MGILTADNGRDTALAWLFVVVQFALLFAVIGLPPGDDWTTPDWLATVASALELVGMATLVVGIVNLGRSLTPLPTPIDHAVLKTGGLYRVVRHPIYSGIIALAVGAGINAGSVPVAICVVALVGWFMLKARWEESHLRRRYPDYDAYAARTPRFVPLWPGR